MAKDAKKCPYCGEEIKAEAIKCKHCGEFLDTPKAEHVMKINIPKPSDCIVGCAWVIGIFIFIALGIVGSFTPDDEMSSNISDNEPVREVVDDYDTAYREDTGNYSGFGSWAVATANLGGQTANCLEKGVGISLVEQIENFFEHTYRPEFYHSKELYHLKENNPSLKFLISNPKWAENMRFPDRCVADIEFSNISRDTIMGYSNGEPHTLDDSYCSIIYTVSEQGGKFKAYLFSMFCKPTYGYR